MWVPDVRIDPLPTGGVPNQKALFPLFDLANLAVDVSRVLDGYTGGLVHVTIHGPRTSVRNSGLTRRPPWTTLGCTGALLCGRIGITPKLLHPHTSTVRGTVFPGVTPTVVSLQILWGDMVVSKGLPYENVIPFYLTCKSSYLPACGQNRGVQQCLEESLGASLPT